jgi:2-dehydropantoate 2-reductase
MGYSESDLPPSVVEDTIANTARFHQAPDGVHHPSLLLDYLHGRPMEVEHVLGEVMRMARKQNIDSESPFSSDVNQRC